MTSEANQAGNYWLSFKGILAYVTPWVMVSAVGRVLAEYSSFGATGIYPYSTGLVTAFVLPITDFVLPIAIGLDWAAIGVTVAYALGNVKHVRAVAPWCFVTGCLS